jgi:hypothetical protein
MLRPEKVGEKNKQTKTKTRKPTTTNKTVKTLKEPIKTKIRTMKLSQIRRRIELCLRDSQGLTVHQQS